jgi:hypothetical protein
VPTSKKSRGHKRLWKDINEWVESNKELDTDQLFSSGRNNIKVPLSEDYSNNSKTAEYKGKTRRLVLKGLLDIHRQWKKALDKIGEPYYLKIWLYEPHFSLSQLVCGIGPFLNFYDKSFHFSETDKEIDSNNYGTLSNQMSDLDWKYALDEIHANAFFVGEKDTYSSEKEYYKLRRWYNNRLKTIHRITESVNTEGENKQIHSFKKGIVWIGGKD